MNLYEILHIAQDAPEEIIKLAYKGLAQKYHPDRYNGADANEKMVQIRDAYETLIDPIKRKKYDYFLAEQKRRQQEAIKNQKFDSEAQSQKNSDQSASSSKSFNMNISIDIPEKISIGNPFISLKNWFIDRKIIFYKLLGGIVGLYFFGMVGVLAFKQLNKPKNEDNVNIQEDHTSISPNNSYASTEESMEAASEATAATFAAEVAAEAAAAIDAAAVNENEMPDTNAANLASQTYINDSDELMRNAVQTVISTWKDVGKIGVKQKIEDCYDASQTNKLFCVYTDLAAKNFHDSGVQAGFAEDEYFSSDTTLERLNQNYYIPYQVDPDVAYQHIKSTFDQTASILNEEFSN